MQLILVEDVEHLGKAGELVSVKPGYARNFLLPKGLAVSATTRNVKEFEHTKAMIERRVEQERGAAEDLANKLNGMILQFERLVGEGDKLYGSVTNKEIGEQLKVAGVEIDHRKIQLSEPIKELGKYEVPIKIHSDVKATLKFWVVAKEQEA
jgi:large subunit ribosomal protein L9